MNLGRNSNCWCGSGKKYKQCHEEFDNKLSQYILKRKKGEEDSTIEINEPEYLNIPAWLFFFLKIVFLVIGYFLLGKFLFLNL